jgi:hypothetical protein
MPSFLVGSKHVAKIKGILPSLKNKIEPVQKEGV